MNTLERLISQLMLKNILTNMIYITVVFIILILIFIIIHHFITERDRKIREVLQERFTKILIGYVIADEPVDLKDLNGHTEYQVFADVCIEIMTNLSKSVLQKIHKICEELDVISYLVNMSTSRSWVKQFYAIEKLGYLEIDHLKGFFTNFYTNSKKVELKIKTIISLSFIADIDSLKFITERLSEEIFLNPKLNEYIYTNVIKSLKFNKNTEQLPMYLSRIMVDENIPLHLKKDLIQACAISDLQESEPVIINYFYNFKDDIDLKIACLRTLTSLKSVNCQEIVFSCLEDKSWQVRAVAVKAAGNFGKEAIPYLKKLLYDNQYNVRINSAKTLAGLGDDGIHVLEEEINSSDKFVRETARLILEIKDKLSYV